MGRVEIRLSGRIAAPNAESVGMEAASAPGSPPLSRDGALPVAPHVSPSSVASQTQPIDGVVTCVCCRRFPLVGEQVTHRVGHKRAGWVCATCESLGRAARLGGVDRTDRVRSLGGAMNVRRR